VRRDDTPEYLRSLGRFAARLGIEDIPVHVVRHLRWVVLDTLPVIALGMRTSEMQLMVKQQLNTDGGGAAWVLGAGRRTSALDAALLNGTAGTWHELDEGNTQAKGHPGIQVLPAVLAVAQERGCSGVELLVALAAGYEVCSRISRAASVSESLHPHGTFGVIGAAVGVGRLVGLSEGEMRSLINIAASMAMATSYNTLSEGATVRNIYSGHSGLMGQVAVEMVKSAFTGEVDGVGTTFGKILGSDIDRELVVEDLGGSWLASEGYFKLNPTARSIQPAIDALDDLLKKHQLSTIDPGTVSGIRVSTYRRAATKNQKRVTNSFGAQFSIPFALASLIYHGRSGLDCFDKNAVANPVIQGLAVLVDVREDPAFTASYPGEQRCELVITMRDGQKFMGSCSIARGEPGNPVAESDLLAKYTQLATSAWGEAIAVEVRETFMNIEEISDCSELARRLVL